MVWLTPLPVEAFHSEAEAGREKGPRAGAKIVTSEGLAEPW